MTRGRRGIPTGGLGGVKFSLKCVCPLFGVELGDVVAEVVQSARAAQFHGGGQLASLDGEIAGQDAVFAHLLEGGQLTVHALYCLLAFSQHGGAWIRSVAARPWKGSIPFNVSAAARLMVKSAVRKGSRSPMSSTRLISGSISNRLST